MFLGSKNIATKHSLWKHIYNFLVAIPLHDWVVTQTGVEWSKVNPTIKITKEFNTVGTTRDGKFKRVYDTIKWVVAYIKTHDKVGNLYTIFLIGSDGWLTSRESQKPPQSRIQRLAKTVEMVILNSWFRCVIKKLTRIDRRKVVYINTELKIKNRIGDTNIAKRIRVIVYDI